MGNLIKAKVQGDTKRIQRLVTGHRPFPRHTARSGKTSTSITVTFERGVHRQRDKGRCLGRAWIGTIAINKTVRRLGRA
eukprot:7571079-Heterocapsa_arctica.AAC.1